MSMSEAVLTGMGREGALLALLLCGHVLGEFVFQTRRMAERKGEVRWLLFHVLELTGVHLLLVLPFLSLRTLPLVLIIGLSHLLVDHLRGLLDTRASRAPALFMLDQSLHLAMLLLVWAVWPSLAEDPGCLYPLVEDRLEAVTSIAVILTAYAFNWNGGAAFVGSVLRRFDLEDAGRQEDEEGDKVAAMGRTIGILERMILLTLVLVGEWGALALVVAAKSIARFKDLEQRRFSEYYLIGTLTSVLVATATGLLVKMLI